MIIKEAEHPRDAPRLLVRVKRGDLLVIYQGALHIIRAFRNEQGETHYYDWIQQAWIFKGDNLEPERAPYQPPVQHIGW